MANDGVLTCTQLQEIELNLEQRWSDNAYAATRSVVKGATIEALLKEQTAVFKEVEDKTNKSNSVELQWLEDCPITTKACDVDCDVPIDSVEFGDNCMTINCDDCVQAATITIDETKLATSSVSFDEMVGRAMYRVDQAIAEALNITAITLLDATSGVNNYADTWGGAVTPSAVAGTCTTMDANIWVDPFNYLNMTSQLNNYTNPYLIGGAITSKYALNYEEASAQNLANGGAVTINGWRHYFDLRAMDTEIGSQKLFMVNEGEFAYVNCYHYPTLAEGMLKIKDGVWVYRIKSPILSAYAGRDIFHDVVYRTACTNDSTVLRRTHQWEILNRFALEQGPADCNGDNNNLCFSCV